jgi:hypothetical protein
MLVQSGLVPTVSPLGLHMIDMSNNHTVLSITNNELMQPDYEHERGVKPHDENYTRSINHNGINKI